VNMMNNIDEETLFLKLESESGDEVRQEIAAIEKELRTTLSPTQGQMLIRLSDLYVKELGIFQSSVARLIRSKPQQCSCTRR